MNNSSSNGFPTIGWSLLENLPINEETHVLIKNEYSLTLFKKEFKVEWKKNLFACFSLRVCRSRRL